MEMMVSMNELSMPTCVKITSTANEIPTLIVDNPAKIARAMIREGSFRRHSVNHLRINGFKRSLTKLARAIFAKFTSVAP
jgi:hypothetical protein